MRSALNVFISYRRSDSSGYSGRIHDRLRAALPEAQVFMDVESIAPGADWRATLAQRIAAADVVLMLVGREWLTLEDAQGRRRIDDPEDITRWELEHALAQGKRVVPVLLDAAAPLVAAQLPASLASLAALQAISIRHDAFDAGLEMLLERLTGKRLRDEAEHARRRFLLERARRWSVPAIGLVIVLLAWTRLFDLFTLDTRLATWTLALADAIAPLPLDPALALVGISAQHDAADPKMRSQYAALLDRLARAEAKIAVMDIHFHEPRAGDEAFADAIRRVRNQGTQVFYSFVDTVGGKPRSVEALAAAATRSGLACAGRRLGYAVSLPLAFDVRETADGWQANPSPSLALLGALGAVDIGAIDGKARSLGVRGDDGQSVQLGFTLLGNPIAGKQACAALSPGTRTAELMLRATPLETLRARRVDFDDMLAGRIDAQRFSGKTVVIGFETPAETFRIAHGLGRENRFGYELQADAINMIKARRITRLVDPLAQAGLAVLLAGLGAGFGVRSRKLSRAQGWGLALAIVLAYMALAVGLAAFEDMLLNSAYDLSAFLFAYLSFRHLARRWLP